MRLWIAICCVVGAATFIGGAHGAVINGTNAANVLNGTPNADTINAKGGNDLAIGKQGADTLDMGCGYDEARGGDGEDLIYVDCSDGKGDIVSCGPNEDIVFWRVAGSVISSNCENVYRFTGAK